MDSLKTDATVLPDQIFNLKPEVILEIEKLCDEYDKITITFLFFDDSSESLRICKKCLEDSEYRFLSVNSIDLHNNWQFKLIECFYYIKHFLLLKKLGFSKYDVDRYFKKPINVSLQRFIFFFICEHLTTESASHIMECMPSFSHEKYAELFFLNLFTSNTNLEPLIISLHSLKNHVINNYVTELLSTLPNIGKTALDFNKPEPAYSVVDQGSAEERYPIKDPSNVGLCFIINEVNCKGQETREGSDADVIKLKTTMNEFNFDVQTYNDVESDFFYHLPKKIETYFKKNHSVFFMILLSHGEEGVIYSSDNKRVSIKLIMESLNFKLLFKIPKVLVIQACQGDKLLLVDSLTTDSPRSLVVSDQGVGHRTPVRVSSYISDFLLAMSTVPGFRSFRNTQEGTFFIQNLCKSMRENKFECIFTILTKTIKMVKDMPPILHKNNSYFLSQQPEMRSLLEKKLYLKLNV